MPGSFNNKMKQQKPRKKTLEQINRQKWANIIDAFFDVGILNNLSRLLYFGLFTFLLVSIVIGIKFKVYNGWFEAVVLMFIAIISLYFADIQLSNLKGIYWLPGIALFFYFLNAILGFRIPGDFLGAAIDYAIIVTVFVVIWRFIIKPILRQKMLIE